MKKFYTLTGVMLMAVCSFGQSPIMQNNYTYAPNVKHAPYAISTVDGRSLKNDFDRAVYYSENFDTDFGGWVAEIQEGPVGFELTNTGHENDPENTFQIPVLETSTPTQWVLVDSDGDGIDYGVSEAATLTSPELDLSDAAGSFVALTFEQFFAEWQPAETSDHCYIGVSTDGTTWTEIEINEGVGREARPNPEYISWDITDFIAGEEANVWIRFRWEGAWNYGWQIDNVQIEDINESDIMITDAYRIYDDGIVYSQVAQAHAQEFVIGAVIKNIGHIDQTTIAFDYTINGPGGDEVASGTATEFIPTLANNEQDTILHATGFTPTELGAYTISWTATSDAVDDNLEDNTLVDDHFMLTEYTMALDYNEGPVYEISNWPLKTGEAYFGNLMQFQTADEATAMLVKLTDYSAIQGELIKASVWEVPEGGAEWLLVYDSDDYTIMEEDLGDFVTFDLESFSVNPTSLYLFCVYQYASAAEPMFERQGDIGFNNVQGRDDEFANRGFFDRAAPLVRVRLNPGEVSIEEEEKAMQFSIYPNPATDVVNIKVTDNTAQKTTVNLVDLSGKVIEQRTIANGDQQLSMDLSSLSQGVYFIEVTNEKGKQIKKVVKR